MSIFSKSAGPTAEGLGDELRALVDKQNRRLQKVLDKFAKIEAKLDAVSRREASEQRKTDLLIHRQTKLLESVMGRLDETLTKNQLATERIKELTHERQRDATSSVTELKVLNKRIQQVAADVRAGLRTLHMDAESLGYPERLTTQRFRLVSQNQEDGITWAIVSAMQPCEGRFVEIGCGLNGGNSGFLAEELGWTGLMIDTVEDRVARVGRRFGQGVVGLAAWITRENVDQILREHGMSGEIDLFSLDIDGNDYWVWEAMTECSPRLVIIEYNSSFGPERSVAVPYAAEFQRDCAPEEVDRSWARLYYGASLPALTHLAAAKGYRLVATEPEGANAYFLRQDVAPEIPAAEVNRAYRLMESQNAFMQKKGADVYDFIKRARLPLVEIAADGS